MKMKNFAILFSAAIAAVAMSTSSTYADLDTSPNYFSTPASSATGAFAWDEFSGADADPFTTDFFSPDVFSTGTGSADLSLAYTFDGVTFPTPLITGTDNLYVGSYFVDFGVDLTSLDTTGAYTTVVLEVAAVGPISSFSLLMDGVPPTNFVDRGIGYGVEHDIDDLDAPSPFDTNYYWAEWQVAADSDYSISFSNLAPHISLSAAQVQYFNSSSVYAATAPVAVPEPTTIGMAGLALIATLGLRRRNK